MELVSIHFLFSEAKVSVNLCLENCLRALSEMSDVKQLKELPTTPLTVSVLSPTVTRRRDVPNLVHRMWGHVPRCLTSRSANIRQSVWRHRWIQGHAKLYGHWVCVARSSLKADTVIQLAKKNPALIQPVSSPPFSQNPTTRPYSEPFESNPHLYNYTSKIHFNIILSSSPTSPKWPPPLGLYDQKFV
jgi:hypothetical protein